MAITATFFAVGSVPSRCCSLPYTRPPSCGPAEERDQLDEKRARM